MEGKLINLIQFNIITPFLKLKIARDLFPEALKTQDHMSDFHGLINFWEILIL